MDLNVFAFNLYDCIIKYDNSSASTNNTIILPKGTLVQIKYEDGMYKVKKCEYNGLEPEIKESEYFVCDFFDFIVINENLWWLILAIPNSIERLKIIESDYNRNFLSKLKTGSECFVIDNNSEYLKCTIQYIGPVPELGLGFYFGLLLNVSSVE